MDEPAATPEADATPGPGAGDDLKTISVTILDADRDRLDVELVARGIATLGQVVEHPERVRLTIAGDFPQAVRDRVADESYAKSYGADRLFGRAVAKTIPQADGTIDLVVDAWLLYKGVPVADVERLFHHEGLHIALQQRGESTHDVRLRRGYGETTNRGYFGGVTGIMVEEYRVERALAEAGRWPHDSVTDSFHQAVDEFGDACFDGITLRYPGEPIDRAFRTILSSFSQLATYTGYVAGEYHASGKTRQPTIRPATRQRLLGHEWDEVVEQLGAIPSAAAATDPGDLETAVWKIADLVERWLERIGFTLKDLPGGESYFDVLRHDF